MLGRRSAIENTRATDTAFWHLAHGAAATSQRVDFRKNQSRRQATLWRGLSFLRCELFLREHVLSSQTVESISILKHDLSNGQQSECG